MPYRWNSSSILSLYYLCSRSYDLSSLGYYGLFIPGHQVWPFQFLHKHKGKVFSLCFTFVIRQSKSSTGIFWKYSRALPHISAGVYARSHDGPFLACLQSDDIACMCIWGLLVRHYKALHPNSPNLRNKSRKKVK